MDAFTTQQAEQRALLEARECDLVQAMKLHGGSFARNIAQAWEVADLGNRAKLRVAFGALLCSYQQFL